MRRILATGAIIAAFAALAVSAHAQKVTLLTERYAERLNEQSKPVYDEGAKLYNHVLYEPALEKFHQAMKLDPGHVKLRFLVADLAIERARMESGDKSIDFYAKATEALDGLLQTPELKSEDQRRAEQLLQIARNERTNVPQRDQRREVTGKLLVEEVIKEREVLAKTGFKPLGLSGDESDEDEETSSGRGGGRQEGGATASMSAGGSGASSQYMNPR